MNADFASMTAPANPLREAIASGRFCYMVELVASARLTEDKLVEMAAALAKVPGMAAAGVTSWAGGNAGHDPIRIAKLIKEVGLTPNVHLTCVSNNRDQAIAALKELHSAGIHNVFTITGDHPQAGKLKKEDLAPLSGFDLDSVQMVELVSEFKRAGYPFFNSVAVSPFKYTEPDCVYQYLKLEKKFAAGADFAITQLGYDARKFRELLQYLRERGINKPVLGNIYILNAPAARKFAKGEPPGCWASETLRDTIQKEAEAGDKGLAARLERAAKMVAVVRGLGYAGAYLGGDHDAEHLRWVIERSKELAPRWEEFAEEISYGPKGGFYLYNGAPRAETKLPLKVRVWDVLNSIALAHKPGLRRAVFGAVMRWFDRSPERAKSLEHAEFVFKQKAFGCQACGNCVLGEMEYVCPMTCPKNLRNGPCGGPLNGMCEVTPEQPCIWVEVYNRAKARGNLDQLRTYIPPRVRELAGTSSYINFYLGRDSRPEHPLPLVQIAGLAKPEPAASRK